MPISILLLVLKIIQLKPIFKQTCVFTGFVDTHSSACIHVAFVTDEHQNSVHVRQPLHILVPLAYVDERLSICDIVDEQGSRCATIKPIAKIMRFELSFNLNELRYFLKIIRG
jgi:hypothetical protein